VWHIVITRTMKMLTRRGVLVEEEGSTYVADIDGFSRHAAGQVVLKLKTPWRDGATHLVISPLEFIQRQAALVPRPRLHLIRFHGVLAPNAKLRAPPTSAPERAQLLKRLFDLDLEHCPNCAGELKIIASILEQPVIEKILARLGLQARAPPFAPARVQALQGELGRQQSSGLLVPGEGSGHWPDAPCKGPNACQLRRFRRPGEPGRWGRLRSSVRGADGSELATTAPRRRL
jgi:hypothetical protein